MNYYLRCLRSTFGASRHPRRSLRFPNQFDVFSKRQSYFHMKITFSIFVDVKDERRGFVRKRLPNVNNFFFVLPSFLFGPAAKYYSEQAASKQAGFYFPSSLLFYAESCRVEASKQPDFRVCGAKVMKTHWKFLKRKFHSLFITIFLMKYLKIAFVLSTMPRASSLCRHLRDVVSEAGISPLEIIN